MYKTAGGSPIMQDHLARCGRGFRAAPNTRVVLVLFLRRRTNRKVVRLFRFRYRIGTREEGFTLLQEKERGKKFEFGELWVEGKLVAQFGDRTTVAEYHATK